MGKKYCKDCEHNYPPQVHIQKKKDKQKNTAPPLILSLCRLNNNICPTREDWEICDNYVAKTFDTFTTFTTFT